MLTARHVRFVGAGKIKAGAATWVSRTTTLPILPLPRSFRAELSRLVIHGQASGADHGARAHEEGSSARARVSVELGQSPDTIQSQVVMPVREAVLKARGSCRVIPASE